MMMFVAPLLCIQCTYVFQVNVWCRKLFPKGDVLSLADLKNPELKHLLEYRLFETDNPSFSQLMDTIAWAFIEMQILYSWFPLLPEETQRQFSELEYLVMEGGEWPLLHTHGLKKDPDIHQIRRRHKRRARTGEPTQNHSSFRALER
jgi:hypothetical protein